MNSIFKFLKCLIQKRAEIAINCENVVVHRVEPSSIAQTPKEGDAILIDGRWHRAVTVGSFAMIIQVDGETNFTIKTFDWWNQQLASNNIALMA